MTSHTGLTDIHIVQILQQSVLLVSLSMCTVFPHLPQNSNILHRKEGREGGEERYWILLGMDLWPA